MAQLIGNASGASGQSGEDIFQNQKSVTCFQEIAIMESVCGIEAPNKYRICKEGNKENGMILYAREQSACLERICLSACRTLTMNVMENGEGGRIVLAMHKPYHCPMIPCPLLPLTFFFGVPCCLGGFMMPAGMTVTDKISNTEIGSIFDPPMPAFKCCIDLEIMDAAGAKIFTCGPKTLCSAGQVCPCFAGEYIPVKNMDGRQVAFIERKPLSIMECCCKINRFEVNFMDVQDANHKKLIFAAGFLLDLQYWEQQKKNNN
jgi:hypothetical protein